jgi:nucleoside-diphosphate-sugar epimerase
VDDLADACLYLMQHYRESEIINVGVGEDLTILELAETVARVDEIVPGFFSMCRVRQEGL